MGAGAGEDPRGRSCRGTAGAKTGVTPDAPRTSARQGGKSAGGRGPAARSPGCERSGFFLDEPENDRGVPLRGGVTSRSDCHVRGRVGGEDRSGNSGGHGPRGPWPGWEDPEELGRRGERPGRLESRGSESSRGREGERDRAPTPGTRAGGAGTPSAEPVAGGAATRRGAHGQARVPRGRCARRSGDPEWRLRLSDAEVEVGRPVLTAESGFYEEAALVSPGPRLALRFRLRCLGSPGRGRLTAPPLFSVSP